MSIFRIFVIPACKSCRSCENVYRLPVSFGTDQVIVTVQHSIARHEHSIARLCDNSDSQTYTQNPREKSTQKTTVKCMSVETALIFSHSFNSCDYFHSFPKVSTFLFTKPQVCGLSSNDIRWRRDQCINSVILFCSHDFSFTFVLDLVSILPLSYLQFVSPMTPVKRML